LINRIEFGHYQRFGIRLVLKIYREKSKFINIQILKSQKRLKKHYNLEIALEDYLLFLEYQFFDFDRNIIYRFCLPFPDLFVSNSDPLFVFTENNRKDIWSGYRSISNTIYIRSLVEEL